MLTPPLFIGHGSPTVAIRPTAARAFMAGLGRWYEERFGRPRAILAVSAHWGTLGPAVSAADPPATIHDFYGFPDALYQLRYPAPGAPELAARVQELAPDTAASPDRGLDHGAWIPLALMWPSAAIPVAQFAIQPRRNPAWHLLLGRKLAPLAAEGVLVVGSGAVVHNLAEAMRHRDDETAPAPAWATAFDGWIDARLQAGDDAALIDYRQLAPHAERAQPEDDHLLPLHVAFGAAGPGARGELLHRSFDYGSLSMSSWLMRPAA